MIRISSIALAAFVLCAAGALCAPALADPTPNPSPSPSPTPSGVSDPCTSILAIVTRPTVTTDVCTVREGHLLVENGYTNTTTTGPGGGNTVAYPQSFVRIGSNIPRIEIDWTPPGYNKTSLGGAVVSGASDMAFGAKWEAGYSANALWGANAFVSVPSGDPAFSAGGTQYVANLNWGYSFNSEISAAGTLGFNWLTAYDANHTLQHFSSIIPSVEFTAGLPDNSEAFVEYAYFSHAGFGLPGKSLIDAGLIHDFGPHLQADIEYGYSPTAINGQKQHYAGFGLSFMY
ncbi:MAG: hypothetical protein JO194_01775 [Candidatus Eremiobacteraeota bacterium]|nr:hypothetical protein [Candidatus Eremiobacteraeota bacterium]